MILSVHLALCYNFASLVREKYMEESGKTILCSVELGSFTHVRLVEVRSSRSSRSRARCHSFDQFFGLFSSVLRTPSAMSWKFGEISSQFFAKECSLRVSELVSRQLLSLQRPEDVFRGNWNNRSSGTPDVIVSIVVIILASQKA